MLGAIGVGIGLGLQKLASNYVSGFVMLAERSAHRDTPCAWTTSSVVADINARFSVIRAPTGLPIHRPPTRCSSSTGSRELSLSDRTLWLSTVLLVPYDVDLDAVLGWIEQAAGPARVLPSARPALSGLSVDGLEITVGYWIGDPENRATSRSDVNRAILRPTACEGHPDAAAAASRARRGWL